MSYTRACCSVFLSLFFFVFHSHSQSTEPLELDGITNPKEAAAVLQKLYKDGVQLEKEVADHLQDVAGINHGQGGQQAQSDGCDEDGCMDNSDGQSGSHTLDDCIFDGPGPKCGAKWQRKCCDWDPNTIGGDDDARVCACNTSLDGPCPGAANADEICAACMGLAEAEGESPQCQKWVLCTFKRRQEATGDDSFCKTATRKGGRSGNGSWYTSDKCTCDRVDQNPNSESSYNQKYCSCREAVCGGGTVPGYVPLRDMWNDPNLCDGVPDGLDSYKVVSGNGACPDWHGRPGIRCGSHCFYDLGIEDEQHDPILYPDQTTCEAFLDCVYMCEEFDCDNLESCVGSCIGQHEATCPDWRDILDREFSPDFLKDGLSLNLHQEYQSLVKQGPDSLVTKERDCKVELFAF